MLMNTFPSSLKSYLSVQELFVRLFKELFVSRHLTVINCHFVMFRQH